MRAACVVASNDLLGECPLWCGASQRLWWVDVLGARLSSFEPKTGERRVYTLPFRRLGSIALRKSGGLVLATEKGLFGFEPSDGRIAPLVDGIPGDPTHRLNDGRCDRRGRFWVGSMSDVDFAPVGSLFRVDADRTVTRMIGDLIIPNSIAFSPDDRTLYFADTRRFVISAFSLDIERGAIGEQRVFADMTGWPGRPDGSCVDETGRLWNASYAGGRIVCFDPNGAIERTVELPVRYPTCCCFGGADLSILFVTSARFPLTASEAESEPEAGGLFAVETKVHGLPEAYFGG